MHWPPYQHPTFEGLPDLPEFEIAFVEIVAVVEVVVVVEVVGDGVVVVVVVVVVAILALELCLELLDAT